MYAFADVNGALRQTADQADRTVGLVIVDAHRDLEQNVHETGLLLQDLAGDLSDLVGEVYDELLS